MMTTRRASHSPPAAGTTIITGTTNDVIGEAAAIPNEVGKFDAAGNPPNEAASDGTGTNTF